MASRSRCVFPLSSTTRPGATAASTLTAGEDWLKTEIVGAQSRAETKGEHAVYADALPGVDVDLSAIPSGLKEALTLADRQGDERLQLRHLAERWSCAGDRRVGRAWSWSTGQSARCSRSRVRASWTRRTPSVRRLATASEELGSGRWSLRFSVDREWLEDAARAWPVVVDPTTGVVTSNAAATLMCPWGGHDVTTVCNNLNVADYMVGLSAPGANQDILLRMAALTYLPASDVIDSAHLKLYQTSTTSLTTDPGVTAIANAANWTSTAPTLPEPAVSASLAALGKSGRADGGRGLAGHQLVDVGR